MPPDDRPGVSRQAASIPEDVRSATTSLTSDVDYAVLQTIKQSGTTRYSWLRQELQIPDQEIVEAIGRLYAAELIERTNAGHGPGRESAYVTTDEAERVLRRLQGGDDESEPEPEPEQETEPEPEPKTERKQISNRRMRSRTKQTGRPKNMSEKQRKKHPAGAPDFFIHSASTEPEDDEENEEDTEPGTSNLRIREPID